ncbi:hypothetical protein G7046_g2822 [Stylonectria norvegica]|nr:hypothetical protein G7046_g2822 [Stylonectria norvegica]
MQAFSIEAIHVSQTDSESGHEAGRQTNLPAVQPAGKHSASSPSFSSAFPSSDTFQGVLQQKSLTTSHPPLDDFRDDSGSETRYLVSSRVLSLASKYFATLFGPKFKEGRDAKQGGEVVLREDDIPAMNVLLSILHHHSDERYDKLSLQMLVAVAKQSDKYQCSATLRPWVSQWVSNAKDLTGSKDRGALLVAIYLFSRPDLFNITSIEVVKHLSPNFQLEWDGDRDLSLLPQVVTDALADEAARLTEAIHQKVCDRERALRRRPGINPRRLQYCWNCGRDLPGEAKQCHPCKNKNLVSTVCDTGLRISGYFDTLEQADIWPSLVHFTTISPSALADRCAAAHGMCKHECDAGENCHLKLVLKSLGASAERILKQTRGIYMIGSG